MAKPIIKTYRFFRWGDGNVTLCATGYVRNENELNSDEKDCLLNNIIEAYNNAPNSVKIDFIKRYRLNDTDFLNIKYPILTKKKIPLVLPDLVESKRKKPEPINVDESVNKIILYDLHNIGKNIAESNQEQDLSDIVEPEWNGTDDVVDDSEED